MPDTSPTPTSSEELAVAVRTDPRAFSDLVVRHMANVKSLVSHYLSGADVECGVQDIWATAHELLREGRYDPDHYQFPVWIQVVGKSVILRQFRERRRRRERPLQIDEALDVDATRDESISSVDVPGFGDLDEDLANALKTLTNSERYMVINRYLLGLKNKDCADLAGCRASAASETIARGVQKLRRYLTALEFRRGAVNDRVLLLEKEGRRLLIAIDCVRRCWFVPSHVDRARSALRSLQEAVTQLKLQIPLLDNRLISATEAAEAVERAIYCKVAIVDAGRDEISSLRRRLDGGEVSVREISDRVLVRLMFMSDVIGTASEKLRNSDFQDLPLAIEFAAYVVDDLVNWLGALASLSGGENGDETKRCLVSTAKELAGRKNQSLVPEKFGEVLSRLISRGRTHVSEARSILETLNNGHQRTELRTKLSRLQRFEAAIRNNCSPILPRAETMIRFNYYGRDDL